MDRFGVAESEGGDDGDYTRRREVTMRLKIGDRRFRVETSGGKESNAEGQCGVFYGALRGNKREGESKDT